MTCQRVTKTVVLDVTAFLDIFKFLEILAVERPTSEVYASLVAAELFCETK